MEHLQKLAFMTIGRACGFGILAIFCITVSFAFDLLLAARAIAILREMSVLSDETAPIVVMSFPDNGETNRCRTWRC